MELLAWTSCAPAAYRRQKIIFGPVAASEKVVHFETQIPYLSVKARIEGQEVGLLVDSGTWGLFVYRNRLRTAPEQLHVDPNASISTAGGSSHAEWLSAEVSLGKGNLGARNVAIADVDSDPQNDVDGFLGLATMGFRTVSFDFENGLFSGSDGQIGVFPVAVSPETKCINNKALRQTVCCALLGSCQEDLDWDQGLCSENSK